jgi:prepilin-type N-terminal cleavage/methylation domain-containing protein
MLRLSNKRGFTLIELLIVIVIIGILAGVLIAVINPVRQQNRSRNAALKAALNKISFGINTARAGIGEIPAEAPAAGSPAGTPAPIEEELENIILDATTCATPDTLNCSFTLSGTTLPGSCAAGSYEGSGTSACLFHVAAPNLTSGQFRVLSRVHKLDPGAAADTYYVFDSSGGLFECNDTTALLDDGAGNWNSSMADLVTATICWRADPN